VPVLSALVPVLSALVPVLSALVPVLSGARLPAELFLSRIVFLLDGFFGFVTLEIAKRERSTAIGAAITTRQETQG